MQMEEDAENVELEFIAVMVEGNIHARNAEEKPFACMA
jgi:hypothetical protein